MAVTTSRERVLNYLSKHQAVTAGEIARDLRMTPANARHHLNALVAEGRVRVVAERRDGRRGRPRQVYRLSEYRLGHNLDGLALGLLRLLESAYPQQEAFLSAAAAALLPSDLDTAAPSSLTPRLNALVDWLNGRHYHARWEAHADGPRVILAHCPYRAILNDYPALCRLDAALLQGFLQRDVTQIARLEAGRQGVPLCVFQIGLS